MPSPPRIVLFEVRTQASATRPKPGDTSSLCIRHDPPKGPLRDQALGLLEGEGGGLMPAGYLGVEEVLGRQGVG